MKAFQWRSSLWSGKSLVDRKDVDSNPGIMFGPRLGKEIFIRDLSQWGCFFLPTGRQGKSPAHSLWLCALGGLSCSKPQTPCSSQWGAGMTVKDCHRLLGSSTYHSKWKVRTLVQLIAPVGGGAELQTQLQSSCLMFQLLSASCHRENEQKQRGNSYLDTGLDHRHLPVWIWGFARDL